MGKDLTENKSSTSCAAAQARASSPKTTSFRLSDIRKLLKGRYGGPCRTADGERYLMAAIPELLPKGRSAAYAVAWARSWVPALLEEHGEEFVYKAWLEVSARKRKHPTTDQLARLLRVADDEPARLNLRCIPAMSRNKKVREADRKAKAAERARRSRAMVQGYVPRSESLAAQEPWKAAGISRTAWYERRREEQPVEAALRPETADLDEFVRIVSVGPSRTVSCAPDPLPPFKSPAGQKEAGYRPPDNDNNSPGVLAA